MAKEKIIGASKKQNNHGTIIGINLWGDRVEGEMFFLFLSLSSLRATTLARVILRKSD